MSSKQKAIEADEDLELSIKLGMLTAVERSSDVTQRKLAQELGIALGLTNAYLKRLVKKGYIKEPAEFNTSVKKSEKLAKIMGFSERKRKKSTDFLKTH